MNVHKNELCEQIYSIEQLCFEDCWSLGMVEEQLKQEGTTAEAYEQDGKAVGFVLGCSNLYDSELYRVAVLPEYRRRGIAAELMKHFLASCREKCGESEVFLEVRSKNEAAVTLYKSFGFEEISVRKRYYNDDDALIMRARV